MARIASFEAEILVGPQERYYPGVDVARFEKLAIMALKSKAEGWRVRAKRALMCFKAWERSDHADIELAPRPTLFLGRP